VPWIFGIMHPTGFPVFTIAGGAFAHLFAFGAVSWRMALFSAVAMSGAAWLVSRIAFEIETQPWLACAAAWLFAFGEVAWGRGTRTEVHAVVAFFAALALYAAVRWVRRGEPAVLVAGALAWGLGMATHPLVALLGPGLLCAFLSRARGLPRRTALLATAAVVAGLAVYAYLPIRSAMVTQMRLDPTVQLGLPPGQSFWDNEHPASFAGFRQVISGADFGAGGTFTHLFEAGTYSGGGMKYALSAIKEFTPLGLALGIIGGVLLAAAEPWVGVTLLLALAVPTDFTFAYTIEADPERYYLISFLIVSVFAAYGTHRATERLPLGRIVAALVLSALAGALFWTNRDKFDQRNDTGAQSLVSMVVQRTPENAILLAPWLDATPLAYAAYVEHRLGHRILHSTWLSDDAQYVPTWIRTRPVYVVDKLWGSVPGYRTIALNTSPTLYRVVKK